MELTFLRKKNSSKIGNGKIKQIHLINSTNIGGTEKTLEKYLHSISLETPIIIYTFQPMGQIGQNLINKNFDIRAPIQVGWFSLVLHVLKLLVKLAGSKNLIIVSWMYQTHLLSLILNCITRDTEVVWHFRSDISQYQEGTITKRASLKIICLFSDKCSKAIFNSKKGRQNHLASGICAKQNFVIYNPICTDEIRHNFRKLSQKSYYKSSSKKKIIGFLGRNAPIKNCSQLLQVFKRVETQFPDTELHLVGRGFDAQHFQNQIRSLKLTGKVFTEGQTKDTAAFFEKIDVFFSASFSEGFPNAIAEAALSGVPILSSDVSDLKNGFLDSWQICAPNDTDGFSEAFRKIFTTSETSLQKLRERQFFNFSKQTDFQKNLKLMIELSSKSYTGKI